MNQKITKKNNKNNHNDVWTCNIRVVYEQKELEETKILTTCIPTFFTIEINRKIDHQTILMNWRERYAAFCTKIYQFLLKKKKYIYIYIYLKISIDN